MLGVLAREILEEAVERDRVLEGQARFVDHQLLQARQRDLRVDLVLGRETVLQRQLYDRVRRFLRAVVGPLLLLSLDKVPTTQQVRLEVRQDLLGVGQLDEVRIRADIVHHNRSMVLAEGEAGRHEGLLVGSTPLGLVRLELEHDGFGDGVLLLRITQETVLACTPHINVTLDVDRCAVSCVASYFPQH